MTTGKLIIITGPSGVGKGTIVRELLQRHPQLYVSISATTRSPRQGEVEGENYYFMTRQQFQKMMEDGQLLEWAEYTGNYYGTPRKPIEENLKQGKQIILEIEIIGARQVKNNFSDTLSIFILPPNLAELKSRLDNRGNNSETEIARRLERAQVEIQAATEFDYQIINDNLEEALNLVEKAIFI